MLGFLPLSPFLVVFLPSCARQGPGQEQGGHFSTWAVTGQGGRRVRALLGGQGCCCLEALWSGGTQLTIPTRNRVRIVQKFLQIPFSTSNSLCRDGRPLHSHLISRLPLLMQELIPYKALFKLQVYYQEWVEGGWFTLRR